MARPNKPLPKQDPSTGVVQVEESAGQPIGARLLAQNKAVERLMKDPANAQGPAGKNWATPFRRTGFNPATYDGMDTDSRTKALVQRMTGHEVFGTNGPARRLALVDLYRAYKHTPHQPASVFLKYLVHRINNVDLYDDPVQAITSDLDFLKTHKQGDAAQKNGHVTGQDLHAWMKTHHSMPEALLKHKAALAAEIARGVGLNTRTINGEPYVALSRGLNTDIMAREHALSSWSDLVEPGFGKFTNHAWVPMKDLWFSFQHGPEEAGGDVGHENEYLVAHTAPRYEAQPEDVKKVRGHHDPRFYDNATDDELAAAVQKLARENVGPGFESAGLGDALRHVQHKNAGPKTLAALAKGWPGRYGEADIVSTHHASREQALASRVPSSLQNPNLTKDDLASKVLQFAQAGTLGEQTAEYALDHPAATADTARAIASQYVPDGRHEELFTALARSPLTPPDVLDQVIARFEQLPPGVNPAAMTYALLNPNHTSAQADRIVRANFAKGQYDLDASSFLGGRYSAQLINELSDDIAKGYGKEPHHTEYMHGVEDKHFKAAKAKFDRAKQIFGSKYNALAKMGMNRNLDDDAIEALVEAAQRHQMFDALVGLAHRQNAAPMAELSQLRVLRALDAVPHPNAAQGYSAVPILAKAKGLAPSTVWALALHPNFSAAQELFHNRTVDPELLAQAWPARLGDPREYADRIYREKPGLTDRPDNGGDPYYHLARAIIERREYAAKRAAEHLIKPWPVGLAKSETDWWPMKLREWMSRRTKEEAKRGYYYRCSSMEEARAIFGDRIGR